MKSMLPLAALATLATSAAAASAQVEAGIVDAPSLSTSSDDSPPEVDLPIPAPQLIPKLTKVSLEILADLSSNQSKSLESFVIKLAEPIMLDGAELVPAGTMGVGEVVHAKKAGGSGAPGELILAARHLEVDGRRMALRSMKLAEVGESRIKDVNTLNTAAAATIPAVSLIGYFVKGGETTVARGTLVEAKLAADFEVQSVVGPKAKLVSADGNADNTVNNEGNENEVH